MKIDFKKIKEKIEKIINFILLFIIGIIIVAFWNFVFNRTPITEPQTYPREFEDDSYLLFP